MHRLGAGAVTTANYCDRGSDATSAGKTIGFDELYAIQTGKTTGTADIAYAVTGASSTAR